MTWCKGGFGAKNDLKCTLFGEICPDQLYIAFGIRSKNPVYSHMIQVYIFLSSNIASIWEMNN